MYTLKEFAEGTWKDDFTYTDGEGNTYSNCLYLSTASVIYGSRLAFASNLSFVWGEYVKSIYSGAFAFCSKLTKISFPCVSLVSNKAFTDCSVLSDIHLPAITRIGPYAFSNCKSLSQFLSFGNVTSMGSGAFQSTGLTSIDLQGISVVPDYCFRYCTDLSIVYGPNVSTVSINAFEGCLSLNTVYLPKVSIIYADAFYGCTNLKSVYLTHVSSVPTLTLTAFSGTPIANSTASIYVPWSLIGAFKSADVWSSYSNNIFLI